MTDPFEDLADQHMSARQKMYMRVAETRAQRKLEKEMRDKEQLFGLWKKWHQERKDALLGGVWREPAQELANFLEHMTLEDAPALVALVEQGPWRDVDEDTRFLVLELISHNIMFLREREGLAPFDDGLPFTDEEPNAFLIIREHLR